MQIILKELFLRNFRGQKYARIDFSTGETAIFGANKAGKSTIMDAFLWLQFSKDSQDRLDHEIKPRPITDRLETEVEAVIIADGEIITLRKLYREKWGKSKGVPVESFIGHEKEHFVNNVPYNAGEYKAYIDSLIPEELFKLITNTEYFNEKITWQKRRTVLQKMAGEIKQYEIEAAMGVLTDEQKLLVISFTTSGKSVEARLKELRANRLKLVEEHDSVPVKINEVKRLVPEEGNFEAIEAMIAENQEGIKTLEASINDVSVLHNSTFKDVQAKQAKVHALQTKLSQHEMKLKSKFFEEVTQWELDFNALNNRKRTVEADLSSKRILLDSTANQLLIKNARRTTLLEYFEVKAKESLKIIEEDSTCPTCLRPFDEGNLADKHREIEQNFNQRKAGEIAEIRSEGHGVASAIKLLDETREILVKAITALTVELRDLEDNIAAQIAAEPKPPEWSKVNAADSTYKLIAAEIAGLEAEVKEVPKLDVSHLQNKKVELQTAIDELRKELNNKSQIEKAQIRIAELSRQEQDLAHAIAKNEQEAMIIQAYERANMLIVSQAVNKLFTLVQFELFTKNINGGYEPDCITTVGETRWDTLNTAGKVQAGIDIINTLSAHYGHTAPIFIDNRESVTEIPETNTQIIDLVVSPEDLTLRIEHIS